MTEPRWKPDIFLSIKLPAVSTLASKESFAFNFSVQSVTCHGRQMGGLGLPSLIVTQISRKAPRVSRSTHTFGRLRIQINHSTRFLQRALQSALSITKETWTSSWADNRMASVVLGTHELAQKPSQALQEKFAIARGSTLFFGLIVKPDRNSFLAVQMVKSFGGTVAKWLSD